MKGITNWLPFLRRWLRGLAIFLTGVSVLSAHDASEITAKARLHADRIEVEFTMAYATATRLLSTEGDPVSLSPKKFPEIKPALEARAPALAVLMVGGEPVTARRTEVELTRDEEIRIQLEFSPARGTVRLDALLLRALASDAYHCLLTIYGPGKNEIRYEALRLGKRACALVPPGG